MEGWTVTHGDVFGSAEDGVDDLRIKRGVETKHWRNPHQHGVGHPWKKKKEEHIISLSALFFCFGFSIWCDINYTATLKRLQIPIAIVVFTKWKHPFVLEHLQLIQA